MKWHQPRPSDISRHGDREGRIQPLIEIMNCQATQVAQSPIAKPSSCNYFRKWGTYHSFDYAAGGQDLQAHSVDTTVEYVGRAPLVPELLTGCRKSPIMAVGINPNLPGWWVPHRGSLNPLFGSFRDLTHSRKLFTWSSVRSCGSAFTITGGAFLSSE